ncbi:MAG: glutathione S-transferase family protein [Pseudomonadota bacterium]|nr:glutathione S-transferase family protein [Pseudomonadota bacterium]
MTALEEAGAQYDDQLINVMKGEQKGPDYLAINPSGKVPTLKVGARILTENAAILLYLDARFPDAALLPAGPALLDRAAGWSDLVWCSSTLHPIARQIRAPFHYTVGNIEEVKAKGVEAIQLLLPRLERRFAAGEWWYGPQWSIIDVYLSWVCATASPGFDVPAYPAVAAHTGRVRARPSFQRMLEREGAAMRASGMQLPPGVAR